MVSVTFNKQIIFTAFYSSQWLHTKKAIGCKQDAYKAKVGKNQTGVKKGEKEMERVLLTAREGKVPYIMKHGRVPA